MIIKTMFDVPAQPVRMQDAKDVTVRVLFGPQDKAPTFAMRLFELAPGGHTPLHAHPFEHEVIILEGDVALVSLNGEKPLRPNDVVLVAPDEQHQFKNPSPSSCARFICLVPIAYQK
ncbi:MAG: cupin domain-containing protein [Planctomycetes bacterium]|jgi:quercetin dioxygenase-like cupin family protein|nr:cupin domain-containing protein [Planctomycetota bacterium]